MTRTESDHQPASDDRAYGRPTDSASRSFPSEDAAASVRGEVGMPCCIRAAWQRWPTSGHSAELSCCPLLLLISSVAFTGSPMLYSGDATPWRHAPRHHPAAGSSLTCVEPAAVTPPGHSAVGVTHKVRAVTTRRIAAIALDEHVLVAIERQAHLADPVAVREFAS
jgi:hypothetical protein